MHVPAKLTRMRGDVPRVLLINLLRALSFFVARDTHPQAR